jgi:hypothetical protein
MEPRRGTKANPFEVGEIVRTTYFRGAAPEREAIGKIVEVAEFNRSAMAFGINVPKQYKVHWLDRETRKPRGPIEYPENWDWRTCRGLESIERPRLEIDFTCPSCGSDPDVDCICKPGG